jgi:transcriptional regulator of acetoin/glycerol metabolism
MSEAAKMDRATVEALVTDYLDMSVSEAEPLIVALCDLLTRVRRHDAEWTEVSNGGGLDCYLGAIERTILLRAMEDAKWNQSLAARRLGLKRPTLIWKLEQHAILSTGRAAKAS